MSKTFLISFLLSWIFLLPINAQSKATSILEIKFTGIQNNKGLIAIGINHSPEGWPRQPHMDPNWNKTNIVEGIFIAQVENLAYGTYAVSVLDDENSNLEMDMWLGIPKEGWGFSMNPPFRLSAPNFEECSFVLDKPFKQITIDLRYAGKGK